MSLHRIFVLREERNAQALWAFLKSTWREFAASGKPLQITITEEKSKRSLEQNKFYWQVLRTIEETAWIHGQKFSSEAWHEHFKRLFIGCIDLPNGQVAAMSSTALGVEEFGKYIEKVQSYACMELGVEFMEEESGY